MRKENNSIDKYFAEYGEQLLKILGYSECVAVYGWGFTEWYQKYHSDNENVKEILV